MDSLAFFLTIKWLTKNHVAWISKVSLKSLHNYLTFIDVKKKFSKNLGMITIQLLHHDVDNN